MSQKVHFLSFLQCILKAKATIKKLNLCRDVKLHFNFIKKHLQGDQTRFQLVDEPYDTRMATIVALDDHIVMLIKGIFREGGRHLSQNGAPMLRYINIQSGNIWQAAYVNDIILLTSQCSFTPGDFFLHVLFFCFLTNFGVSKFLF